MLGMGSSFVTAVLACFMPLICCIALWHVYFMALLHAKTHMASIIIPWLLLLCL